VGEAFASPQPADSLRELGRALSKLAGRDRTREFIESVAAETGVGLGPAACWMLFRYSEDRTWTVARLHAAAPIPVDVLERGRGELVSCGYVEDAEDGTTVVTAAGSAVEQRLRAAARARLTTLLEGWEPEDYPDLVKLMNRLAGDLAQAPPPDPQRVTA
jgi:hypothetical protein